MDPAWDPTCLIPEGRQEEATTVPAAAATAASVIAAAGAALYTPATVDTVKVVCWDILVAR